MAMELPPGLAGYVAAQQQNQQGQLGQLQQAQVLMGLQGQMQQQQQRAQIEGVIKSSGSPEEAIANLAKLGPHGIEVATKIAQMQEHQGKAATANQLAGASPSQMQDPAFLDRLALRDPRYEVYANQARKKLAEADQLRTMQGTPTTIQPDPQEVAQAADQGTPAVAPVTSYRGGDPMLEGLTQSENPQIAAQAKALKAQIERLGPNTSPAVWQGYIKSLADRETALINRPVKSDVRVTVGSEPVVGDFSKSGDAFLNSLPEKDRALVKKIANYDIDPKTLSTKGGQREKMLSLVTHYNPDYDDTQYANKRRAITQFGSGPQGNTVRSLNVAIEHIDTLGRAADAMKNGEFTPRNKVWNEVGKVFGKTPANTFEGIRDMVANEVVKGTIGNAGALADREEAARKIRAANSPEQFKELMNAWVELMGGQVKGLERQYESSTKNKDFRDRYLTQRARDAIGVAEKKAGVAPAQAGPFADHDKERRYQEWKKANGG